MRCAAARARARGDARGAWSPAATRPACCRWPAVRRAPRAAPPPARLRTRLAACAAGYPRDPPLSRRASQLGLALAGALHHLAVELLDLVHVALERLHDAVAVRPYARVQLRHLLGTLDDLGHDRGQPGGRRVAVHPARLAVAGVLDDAAARIADHRDRLGEELDAHVAVGLLPHGGHDAHVEGHERRVEALRLVEPAPAGEREALEALARVVVDVAERGELEALAEAHALELLQGAQ